MKLPEGCFSRNPDFVVDNESGCKFEDAQTDENQQQNLPERECDIHKFPYMVNGAILGYYNCRGQIVKGYSGRDAFIVLSQEDLNVQVENVDVSPQGPLNVILLQDYMACTRETRRHLIQYGFSVVSNSSNVTQYLGFPYDATADEIKSFINEEQYNTYANENYQTPGLS